MFYFDLFITYLVMTRGTRASTPITHFSVNFCDLLV